MHIRRSVLEAIRTQLQTMPDFGGVYIQMRPPIRAAYPCITFYSPTETTDTLTVHSRPRPQERGLTVEISCWIRGTPDSEKVLSDMDDCAVKIETAMNSNFGTDDSRLLQTDFIQDEDEPELHQLVLTYLLPYSSTESNPTV